MNPKDSAADPVAAVADEFIARFRRGERPAVSEYTQRHPDLAERLRQVIPLMVMMEQAASGAGVASQATAADAEGHAAFASLPQQIGGYRIIREIGRGGMGVVYEAEQTTLGRRVALKVLPLQPTKAGSGLDRFRLEARAAARLHHSNIVPVYEVGEDGEHCYYAMQFIQGQALDAVLDDLRRLRRPDSDAPPPEPTGAARSLLTGLAPTDPAGSSEGKGKSEASSSSVNLPGHTDISTAETHRSHYYRSVARVGVQVAEALDYAHREGVVHRDVKPSNLLLDADGRVWVADFGLAKTDGAALTQTDDVVGTIRYMAPERFRGWSDPRSDVYSLGLTLYEMLLLRPAFVEADRLKLIHHVTNEEPARLRKADARIPRDLETIVHKAIDKEPSRRYPTAAELAADLQRFVDDRPILARRIGGIERTWRWCRRNPAVASLIATVVFVFLAGFAATAWQMRVALANEKMAKDSEQKAKQLADEKENTNKQLEQANKDAKDSEQKAKDNERKANHEAYVSDMNGVKTAYDGDNLMLAQDNLNRYLPWPEEPDERGFVWRYWQRQCHAELETLTVDNRGRELILSPDGALAAYFEDNTPDQSAQIKVLNVTRGEEVFATEPFTWVTDPNRFPSAPVLRFSDDGKRLAIGTNGFFGPGSEDVRLMVWDLTDLTNRKPSMTIRDNSTSVVHWALSHDGRLVATVTRHAGSDEEPRPTRSLPRATRSYSLKVWDGTGDKPIAEIALSGAPSILRSYVIAFHPDGQRIAVAESPSGPVSLDGTIRLPAGSVWILDAATGDELVVCDSSFRASRLNFSPDGKQLLGLGLPGDVPLSATDHLIGQVWDAENGKLLAAPVADVRRATLAVSPDGKYVSCISGSTVQVRNAANWQLLRTVKQIGVISSVAYSADGSSLLTAATNGKIKRWALPEPPANQEINVLNGVTVASPDGTRLASIYRRRDVVRNDSPQGGFGSPRGRFGLPQDVCNDLSQRTATFLAQAAGAQAMAPGGPAIGPLAQIVATAEIARPDSARRPLSSFLSSRNNLSQRTATFLAQAAGAQATAPGGPAIGPLAQIVATAGITLPDLPRQRSLLSSSRYDLSVRDIRTRKELLHLENLNLSTAIRSDQVQFSPDGTRLAVLQMSTDPVNRSIQHGKIDVWLIDAKKKMDFTIRVEDVPRSGGPGGGFLSPDDPRFGSPSRFPPQLHYRPDGRMIALIVPHGEKADGPFEMRAWDANTGKLRFTTDPVDLFSDFQFTPDSRSFIAVVSKGRAIRVWDANTGKKRPFQSFSTITTEGTIQPRTLTASRDGSRFAAVVSTNRASDTKSKLMVWNAGTGEPQAEFSLKGTYSRVRLSPDGRLAVVLDSSDDHFSRIMVWDVENRQLYRTIEDPASLGTVTFSPDGRHLAGVASAPERGEEVRIWDVPTGRQLLSVPLPNQGFISRGFGGRGGFGTFGSGASSPFFTVEGHRLVVTRGDSALVLDGTPLPKAPQPAATVREKIPGWGDVIDPLGDCTIKAQDSKLTITVPGGTIHDFHPTHFAPVHSWTAPRVLRSVEGAFILQVKVSGKFQPGIMGATGRNGSWQGAGLLLWSDTQNLIKVSRVAWTDPNGVALSSPCYVEAWKNGALASATFVDDSLFKGPVVYLRLERRKEDVRVRVSSDGQKWTDVVTLLPFRLPPVVQVGMLATSTSKEEPLTAEFEELVLKDLSPTDTGDPLPLPEVRKPAPKPALKVRETIPGWGNVIDPLDDCTVVGREGKLTITVPGTLHDLNTEKYQSEKGAAAPRVLQSVTGDFVLQVKVSGTFHPARPAEVGQLAYHGGGLLLWSDEQNYLRLERAAVPKKDGTAPKYLDVETWTDGQLHEPKKLPVDAALLKGPSAYLRLERRKGEVRLSVSADGQKWIDATKPLSLDLPPTVQVGVDAVNTSKEPLTAEFTELQLIRKSGESADRPGGEK